MSADTYTMVVSVTAMHDAPSIVSTAVVTAVEDTAYAYNVVATDPDVGQSIAITAPWGLPYWLTLVDHNNGTATLAGMPGNDEVGVYGVSLSAWDSNGDYAEQEFVLNVVNVNDAPVFSSAALLTATQDVLYGYEIVILDVDAGDWLTISSAITLPQWLILGDRGDGTGTLTGEPGNEQVGDYAIELRAQDAAGAVAAQDYTLTALDVNEAPRFSSIPVGAVAQGELYSATLTATDPDVGELLSFSVQGQPAWLNLTDHGDGSATLDGAPTQLDAGGYPVAFVVQDRDGLTDTQPLTLTVLNIPPVAENDSASTQVNTPVELDLRANDHDAEANPLSVVAVGQPAYGAVLLLDAANARYTPAADFVGSESFTYTLSDGQASSVGYAFVDVLSNPPVSDDDTGETVSGFPVTLDVLNNDFDPDGEPLEVIEIDIGSTQGSVLIGGSRQDITYRPPNGFVGVEVFTYTAQVVNDISQRAQAQVTVNVLSYAALQSDVSLTRDSTPLAFPEGEAREIVSMIYVTNNDPTDAAGGVVLIDTFNVETLSGQVSSGQGVCQLTATGTECDLGMLPPLQTVLVETRFVVATQAGMEMQSTVSSLTDDPDLGNNNAVTVFDVTAGRSTRQAGAWPITADVFSFLPGSGNTQGQGNILIGEHFKLSGADDAVEFNAGGIVQITGTLAYVMGDKDIVSGVYNVDAGGFLTFSQLDELNMDTIGGFDVGDATLTQVNFGSGRLAGQVALDVDKKGDSQIPTMLLGMVMYPGDVLGSQPTEPFTVPYNAGNVLQLNNVVLNTVNRAGAYRL